MTGRLMTIGETADRLHISKPTIRRWIRDGTLAAHKLGGQIRIQESDVDALLEASRIRPAQGSAAASATSRPAPATGGLRELLRAETPATLQSECQPS